MAFVHSANGYKHHGCRCRVCLDDHARTKREYRARKAKSAFGSQRSRHGHDELAELLRELAPFGLTNDCPMRQQ